MKFFTCRLAPSPAGNQQSGSSYSAYAAALKGIIPSTTQQAQFHPHSMFLPTSLSVKVRTHGTTKISSHIFSQPGKHLLRLVSYLLVHIDTMANKNKKFPTLVQNFTSKFFIQKHSPLQNTPVFQICYRSLTKEIYNSV